MKITQQHIPCPKCPSSDAYNVYEDGHGYCFSCKGYVPGDEMEVEGTGHYEYVARRGISKSTHEFFQAKAKIDDDGVPAEVHYTYPNGAIQRKFLREKGFRPIGPISTAGGWGPQFFAPGSAKSITITEGNDDAMAAWQMLGKYPVYAVKSASTAVKDVKIDYEYLNSFERIYLALDADKPGQEASDQIAAIFGFQKVYHVNLAPLKDATEYAEAGKAQEFKTVWWNSQRYLPEGIVSSFSEIDRILDSADAEREYSWPFPTLDYITDGIKLGKAYMFSGLEGKGKTEIFHAVEYHLAKQYPDLNIGIIHLEEDFAENIKKKASYELQQNVLFSDTPVSADEIKTAYKKVFGREDRIHFYNHHGSDDPDVLLAKIRFFVAACECKVVFFDNITIIGTGRNQDDERKELDYLSTQLEMLCKELKFALVFISHENDFEQTRGSRNISKVCDVWVNIKRDTEAESDFARSLIYLTVKKGRGCRRSGPAGRLVYHADKAILEELTEELPTE
jgi:twinkle protein